MHKQNVCKYILLQNARSPREHSTARNSLYKRLAVLAGQRTLATSTVHRHEESTTRVDCSRCSRDSLQLDQKHLESDERHLTLRTALLVLFVGGFVYVVIKHKLGRTYCEVEAKSENIGDSRVNEIPRKRISLETAVAEAQKLCQRVKDESGSPGLVVAVSVDGQQVWAQGLGLADVENHVPCTANTVMRIGSISKSITMAAVARAMETGDLDLDKPVQAYVPKFPEKVVDGEKVTLTTRHLVSHLGGIRHYDRGYMQKQKEQKEAQPAGEKSADSVTKGGKDDVRETLRLTEEFDNPEYFIKRHFPSTEASLTLFQNDPLVHRPGSRYLYTTHGWTLVAAVLEGATKRKYVDLAQELFTNLGLESTYLDEHQPLIYNRARFYSRTKKGKLVNAPYVDCSYKYAGGGMLSTAPDLLRFGNTMLYSYQFQPESQSSVQAGNTDGGKPGYLTAAAMRQIWEPVTLRMSEWDKDGFYAMGWSVVPEKQDYGCGRKQRLYISHTGASVGASSVLLILPPSRSEEEVCHGDNLPAPPRGVVVAIIVNMISVGLCKTALKIAKLFENVAVD